MAIDDPFDLDRNKFELRSLESELKNVQKELLKFKRESIDANKLIGDIAKKVADDLEKTSKSALKIPTTWAEVNSIIFNSLENIITSKAVNELDKLTRSIDAVKSKKEELKEIEKSVGISNETLTEQSKEYDAQIKALDILIRNKKNLKNVQNEIDAIIDVGERANIVQQIKEIEKQYNFNLNNKSINADILKLLNQQKVTLESSKVTSGKIIEQNNEKLNIIGSIIKGLEEEQGKLNSIFNRINSIVIIQKISLAIIKLTTEAYKKYDEVVTELGKKQGVLRSEARQQLEFAERLSSEYENQLLATKNVADAVASINNEFGLLVGTRMQEAVKRVAELSAVLGISAEESTKFVQTLAEIGGTSFQAQQNMAGFANYAAQANGVPLGVLIKDVVTKSSQIRTIFRNNTEELIKQTAEVRKLGSDLESAGRSAEQLLDFESSISAELKASALTGVNINLQAARRASFVGDLVGQEKAIFEELQKIGDFESQNIFVKKAMAEATGKTVAELQKMYTTQKTLNEARSKDPAWADKMNKAQIELNALRGSETKQRERSLELAKLEEANKQRSVALDEAKLQMMLAIGKALEPIITPLTAIAISIAKTVTAIINLTGAWPILAITGVAALTVISSFIYLTITSFKLFSGASTIMSILSKNNFRAVTTAAATMASSVTSSSAAASASTAAMATSITASTATTSAAFTGLAGSLSASNIVTNTANISGGITRAGTAAAGSVGKFGAFSAAMNAMPIGKVILLLAALTASVIGIAYAFKQLKDVGSDSILAFGVSLTLLATALTVFTYKIASLTPATLAATPVYKMLGLLTGVMLVFAGSAFLLSKAMSQLKDVAAPAIVAFGATLIGLTLILTTFTTSLISMSGSIAAVSPLIPIMLALGAAITLVGAGAALLGLGMKLAGENVWNFIGGFTALLAVLALAVAGIKVFGIGIGVLYALGGAITLVGAGAALLGFGIEKASNGFQKMSTSLENIKVGNIYKIGAALSSLILPILFFPTSKFNNIAENFNKLANTSEKLNNLNEIVKNLKDVKINIIFEKNISNEDITKITNVKNAIDALYTNLLRIQPLLNIKLNIDIESIKKLEDVNISKNIQEFVDNLKKISDIPSLPKIFIPINFDISEDKINTIKNSVQKIFNNIEITNLDLLFNKKITNVIENIKKIKIENINVKIKISEENLLNDFKNLNDKIKEYVNNIKINYPTFNIPISFTIEDINSKLILIADQIKNYFANLNINLPSFNVKVSFILEDINSKLNSITEKTKSFVDSFKINMPMFNITVLFNVEDINLKLQDTQTKINLFIENLKGVTLPTFNIFANFNIEDINLKLEIAQSKIEKFINNLKVITLPNLNLLITFQTENFTDKLKNIKNEFDIFVNNLKGITIPSFNIPLLFNAEDIDSKLKNTQVKIETFINSFKNAVIPNISIVTNFNTDDFDLKIQNLKSKINEFIINTKNITIPIFNIPFQFNIENINLKLQTINEKINEFVTNLSNKTLPEINILVKYNFDKIEPKLENIQSQIDKFVSLLNVKTIPSFNVLLNFNIENINKSLTNIKEQIIKNISVVNIDKILNLSIDVTSINPTLNTIKSLIDNFVTDIKNKLNIKIDPIKVSMVGLNESTIEKFNSSFVNNIDKIKENLREVSNIKVSPMEFSIKGIDDNLISQLKALSSTADGLKVVSESLQKLSQIPTIDLQVNLKGIDFDLVNNLQLLGESSEGVKLAVGALKELSEIEMPKLDINVEGVEAISKMIEFKEKSNTELQSILKAVETEIKGLRGDMSSGKIAVYVDGVKVNYMLDTAKDKFGDLGSVTLRPKGIS